MAKKKENTNVEESEKSVVPIETLYGNGDLNELRDKINEIIEFISSK